MPTSPARHALNDTQWSILESLLPPHHTGCGRKMHDRRTIINGILWILRTDAPWRDLPKHYGHWYSLYARFRLWQHYGTWKKVLAELLNRYDIEGKIDWSLFSVDGTIVKAHKASGRIRRRPKKVVCIEEQSRGIASSSYYAGMTL